MFITTLTNLYTKRFVAAACLLAIICCAPSAATAQTPPPVRPCFDFTGSGRTSFAVTNRNLDAILWRILGNTGTGGGSIENVLYGISSIDRLTPGYFDGDNRADLNVYRATQSTYYLRSTTSTSQNSFQALPFGLPSDLAGREADYDGDGRDDFTVVRDGGASLTWFFLRSSNNTVGAIRFGAPGFTAGGGDIPIAGADYTGDGRAEITVIRNNPNGADVYFAADSNTGALVLAQPWGEFDTDFYVVGDYLGDRRADFAVYRAFQGGTNGTWFIRENGGSGVVTRQFGFTSLASVTDRPICGDYNGDGKQDIAIYRSSNSTFYWLNSPNFDTFTGVQFGTPGDSAVAGLRAF